MRFPGAVFTDSTCTFVIIGSKKMMWPSYEPYRNVRVKVLLFGGGWSSGDVGSTQCAPIIGTPPGSLMFPAGRYSSAGILSSFTAYCGSLGRIAIWAASLTV